MADPTVYGPGYSTYVRTVRLVLAEKGVPYRLEEFDFIADGIPEEHRARHPFGKVPAFEHDGFSLYETCAIARYVDEAFDGPALQPSDARGRARMTQIESIIDSYTYGPTVGQVVIQRLVVPMTGGETDEAAVEAALPGVRTAFGVLDAFLGERSFLVGDTLGIADLHLVPVYHYFSLTPEAEQVLPETPNLRRWWEGIGSRESVRETEPSLG